MKPSRNLTERHSVGLVFIVGYPVIESSFDITAEGKTIQNREWTDPLRPPEIVHNPPNGAVQVVAVEEVNIRVQLACWALVKEHHKVFNEALCWSLPMVTVPNNPRWYMPSAPPITEEDLAAAAESAKVRSA